MKSDQEFLEGVYEKARAMSKKDQEDDFKTKQIKNRTTSLRWGTAAAILLFLCSAGVYMQGWRKEAAKEELHTPNVTSFRMEIPGGAQQLVQEATDIIELEVLQGEGNSPVIHQIYKASVNEKKLLAALERNAVSPDPERRLLVFLKIDAEASEILNVMSEDEEEGTYTSPFMEAITKDELEAYISNQAVE
jgi:hypothetical protein